jgi:hypothetical protein
MTAILSGPTSFMIRRQKKEEKGCASTNSKYIIDPRNIKRRTVPAQNEQDSDR